MVQISQRGIYCPERMPEPSRGVKKQVRYPLPATPQAKGEAILETGHLSLESQRRGPDSRWASQERPRQGFLIHPPWYLKGSGKLKRGGRILHEPGLSRGQAHCDERLWHGKRKLREHGRDDDAPNLLNEHRVVRIPGFLHGSQRSPQTIRWEILGAAWHRRGSWWSKQLRWGRI